MIWSADAATVTCESNSFTKSSVCESAEHIDGLAEPVDLRRVNDRKRRVAFTIPDPPKAVEMLSERKLLKVESTSCEMTIEVIVEYFNIEDESVATESEAITAMILESESVDCGKTIEISSRSGTKDRGLASDADGPNAFDAAFSGLRESVADSQKRL
jgi:hypothetical protein